jgi:hypothetical protein
MYTPCGTRLAAGTSALALPRLHLRCWSNEVAEKAHFWQLFLWMCLAQCWNIFAWWSVPTHWGHQKLIIHTKHIQARISNFRLGQCDLQRVHVNLKLPKFNPRWNRIQTIHHPNIKAPTMIAMMMFALRYLVGHCSYRCSTSRGHPQEGQSLQAALPSQGFQRSKQ